MSALYFICVLLGAREMMRPRAILSLIATSSSVDLARRILLVRRSESVSCIVSTE